MTAYKYNILAIFVFFFTLSSFSQNIVVEGSVYGIDGAIEKVKISVVNSSISTFSDANGDFTISVPNSNSQLNFKYKGINKTANLENGALNSDVFLLPSEKKLYRIIAEKEELRLCDMYLKQYPNGNNMSSVKQIKEKAFFIEAYNIAAAKFSDTALQNYLKLYPEGAFVAKANDAIEIASWQKARYDNTIESYELYLTDYPDGKASNIAKQKLAELEK